MKEIAGMKAQVRFKKACGRFCSSLLSSVEYFRTGKDPHGLDSFLNSLDDLEFLLELDQFLETPKLETGRILPVIKKLRECMQNQDITGMTDLLEFELYPVAKELVEGEGKE